jgi:hypothetical protein
MVDGRSNPAIINSSSNKESIMTLIAAIATAIILTQVLVFVGCKRWGQMMEQFDKDIGYEEG